MVLRTKHPIFTVTQNSRIGTRKVPHINLKLLQKICRMPIKDFASYGEKVLTKEGVYFFKDNKAKILAVAHLDFVLGPLHFTTAKLHNDRRIFCPNLDDRLGVYAITEYLNNLLKMRYDILLTTGEERLRSTAAYFANPKREYNWMFSVDRAGIDVVNYQYKNSELDKLLVEAGWEPRRGSYSDIVELEHLRCKGINFGAGYYLQHSENSYASEMDFLTNMTRIKIFYDSNKDKMLEHLPSYNTYSEEEGFTYVHRDHPNILELFSKDDIQLIERLVSKNYDFGNNLIRKPDLYTLRREEQETDTFLKNFEDKEKTKLKLIIPSEDSPEFSSKQPSFKNPKIDITIKPLPIFESIKQETKILNTHFAIEEAVVLSTGPENNEEFEEVQENAAASGFETTAPTECTTCHKIFEMDFNAKTTECPDCSGELDQTLLCKGCGKDYIVTFGSNEQYCQKCFTEMEAIFLSQKSQKLQKEYVRRSITIPIMQKKKGWLYEVKKDGTWGWVKYKPGTPEFKEYFEDIADEIPSFKEVNKFIEEEVIS